LSSYVLLAAEAAAAEPWQVQCAQLKSDKSVLSSRLHAAEAAAAAAAVELKGVSNDLATTGEENQMLNAEMQELRHQVLL
jgi:hypothetical protein